MLPFKNIFSQLLAPQIPELNITQIMISSRFHHKDCEQILLSHVSLARTRGQSPVQITNEIAMKVLETNDYTITTKWPYINISFSP